MTLSFFVSAQFEYDEDGRVKQKKVSLEERVKKMLERKVSLSPTAGVVIFSNDNRVNGYGFQKDIYASFTPGLFLGFAANYKFTDNIFLGSDIGWVGAAKTFYTLNAFSFNANVKYYFFGTKKKISPYATFGLNMSFININQDAHKVDIPDPKTAPIGFADPLNIKNRFDEFGVFYGPLLGANVGAGVQYKLNSKYSLFLQVSYNPSFTSVGQVSESFPGNTSNFQFTSIKGGVVIKLFKPKPPEIDTNMIFIPDEIFALDVIEDQQGGSLLVREGVFDILLREGLRHNVKVNTGTHEIVIDEEIQDPCKVTCYLYDENGDILSVSESTPEGKIVFTDLNRGIYDLAFVLEKPCQSANFKYKFPDPNTNALMNYNTEGGMDSVLYNIEGSIHIPDSAQFNFVYRNSPLFVKNNDKNNKQNYDISVLLANEDNRIIKRFDPKKNENFVFRQLAPAVYDIIYKVPDAEMKTGFIYTISDNYKKAIRKAKTNSSCDSIFTAAEKAFKKDAPKYVLKGKVTFLDTLTKADDVTLYLVNCFKKIESTKKPNQDGSFSFSNLHSKSDYSVYYELKDPQGKIDLYYKIEDPFGVKAALTSEVPKVITSDIQVWNDNTEYDIKGNIVKLNGYAVQVGASDNFQSVNSLCKKLIDDGFAPITIQVLGTSNLNKRFAFSKNFKLFKVLVGTYKEENLAIREKYKLQFYSYDAYVVKHFD